MSSTLKILAVSGSLRKASLNTSLVAAAAELAPEGVQIERWDISEIPLYNGDIPEGSVPAVEAFKGALAAADAVLIATPEYNFGIPGVLKNAIDWASRPAFQSPFKMKPTAIVGASPGAAGTARAQGQLKQVLLGMGAQVYPANEYLLGQAHTRFDAEGHLTDPKSREVLASFLTGFSTWVRRVR